MHLGASAGSQNLVYNSITRIIEPAAGASGIYTEVDYNFATNDPTTTWLGGEIQNDGSGSAHIFISADADLPFLGAPALTPVGITALVLSTGAAGILLLRTARQRRARAT